MFTNRDYQTDYEESESISIQLNGTSASSDSDSVTVSGSTITITEEGIKGVELIQNSVLAAQLFHAHVRLGRENLEGECRSLFINVRYAHNCLHIQNRLPEWLHTGAEPVWIRYKIIVSHLTGNYKTCGAQIYEKKHFFLHS